MIHGCMHAYYHNILVTFSVGYEVLREQSSTVLRLREAALQSVS